MVKEMEHLSFTYDPLQLVHFALEMFVDERKGKSTKAIQFARYEYLRTMTDEELEGHLVQYMKDENLSEITLHDWRKDAQYIFKYIYNSERYKDLVFKYNKKGYGETGLGVIDKLDNTFYDCDFTGHWDKVMEIINEKYPEYHEALITMKAERHVLKYKGVSREEIDTFIMTNFELVGENKSLNKYL